MAKLVCKFRPGLIKPVIEAMCNDAEAVWPTSGEMVAILLDAETKSAKAADHGPMSLKRRVHREYANINGWRYDQIIKRTKRGRKAAKAGKMHSFLMGLAHGQSDLPEEMASYP